MGAEFSPEQKRYLEGFVAGIAATRASGGLGAAAPSPAAATPEPVGPDAAAHRAMARTEAQGRKLVNEEKIKREELGLDSYARMKQHAREGVFPKGGDVFRWKFHGLFYVAPTQDSYMCRLRIPNGILSHWQFAGIADIAARHAGGYSDVTTRANLQLREIPAGDGPIVLEKLVGLGLTSRGSGADNIRNVTGSPTAGIDPQELLDTRPYALEWHHHILADRSLYGLPRKFNVAFDGGGAVGALEDTNDIGFQAVAVAPGHGVAEGVWFRLVLGGITGHLDLARDTGVIVPQADATRVADAIVRVFIEHGDRTDRRKARLKYVLDAWGFEKFLAATEAVLGEKLARVPPQAVAPRPAVDRFGHVGVHRQAQPGLNWVGVVLPLGRMSVAQMHGLAAIARDLGDGDLRLTVWQNLILSGIAEADVALVEAALEALGLTARASAIRAGLVACTGAAGCKFGNADTKATAEAIARHCESRVDVDLPVNIHVTGCHHSCAQHYIGDIGLVGARVPVNEEGDTVAGYHVVVGGGFGSDAAIAREVWRDVRAEDAPQHVEALLRTWLAHRADASETLAGFSRRHEPDVLRALVAAGPEQPR
ncbi:NirA family protein [Ancylobacter dichloromethanicus]|uniref:Ferredoxin--nitrite reductase n=1 Tax=Ancylobacter dichloromethanicus TaxID=518825 RepID=A0A9W6JAR5_9HYPH|nr:NirA family protein [Ancylobacter dichloromethanicus]MBS7555866.1 NirA family protein [Ancylobacter dichloromethanicus]GLK72409.1 ferredoxin--nitrite reductase [Ancylobacter dichloromethanicus]